jgi:hypothetical protein
MKFILILHRLGDPNFQREAVKTLEFMVKENQTDFACFVHDADLPFPHFLRYVNFSAIILGPTFLCARYDEKKLNSIKRKYSFVQNSAAVKVALPQDDYDCCQILDTWLSEWKIDIVYTICPEHWDILYPQFKRLGEIRLGFTGYIPDDWISKWSSPRAYSDRKIDISYRGSKLPPNFGFLGQLKYLIADRVKNELSDQDSKINIDISTKDSDMIAGESWHEFMESSKACLVAPAGSSLLDPDNNIRSCITRLSKDKKYRDFSEVEELCFSGQDGNFIFSMLSPRNVEAALSETLQIAFEGSFSGLLKPHEDYLLLRKDCKNINEIIEVIKCPDEALKIITSCKKKILSVPRLRQRVIVDEIIEYIKNNSKRGEETKKNLSHIIYWCNIVTEPIYLKTYYGLKIAIKKLIGRV